MSGFAVDLALLADTVERMAACSRRLEQVHDDVDARVRRMHATWRGAAAVEHAEAHRRWIAGAAQLHDALGVLRSIATTAGENYEAAADANRRMWAR